MAFVIDTEGQRDLLINETNTSNIVESEDESDDDFQFIPLPKKSVGSKTNLRSTDKWKESELDLNDTYLDFGEPVHRRKVPQVPEASTAKTGRHLTNTDKMLEKSVLKPGVEKLRNLPTYDEGRRRMMKQRKKEREKSAGRNWYNMKAPEITEEMRNDLEVLKMRSALDPKHFYKKNDFKVLPKYFQVGRVMDSAADFYHSRIPKKERKKTFVDELLADAEFQKSTKKRYKEIIAEQRKSHYKAHRQAKRLKKNKK